MSGYYPCGARDRYERLKELGICVSCGQRDAMSGHVLCSICRMSSRDSSRLVYYDRVEAKRCTRCGQSMLQDGSVCPSCAEALRKSARERRARLIQAGICVRCGKRPAEDGRECALCRARRNNAA